MTTKALAKLALIAELPSSGRPEHVAIETMFGWHYLIETDADGKRRRLMYRVSTSGAKAQHFPSEFDLQAETETQFLSFRPTLRDLGIREEAS